MLNWWRKENGISLEKRNKTSKFCFFEECAIIKLQLNRKLSRVMERALAR
jgi:hypothetical protein